MPSNCIDTRNYAGVRTILTENQRQIKMVKHPELRDDGFIKRVKETIENPGFIYEDFAESDRLVYYRHEYSVNGQPRYVKVSIDIEKIPYFVITAFRPARVKERGKTKLIHGNDEQ